MEALSDRTSRLHPHKICIIKPNPIGDIVHSLPNGPRALTGESRVWCAASPRKIVR